VLQAHDITLHFGGVIALANVGIDARDHADLPEFYLGLDREGASAGSAETAALTLTNGRNDA